MHLDIYSIIYVTQVNNLKINITCCSFIIYFRVLSVLALAGFNRLILPSLSIPHAECSPPMLVFIDFQNCLLYQLLRDEC